MHGNDKIALTLRRNDLRLILGALIAEAHMHAGDSRHATAAWAHDVAAKIAAAIGDEQSAAQQRIGAARETTRWQEQHAADEIGAAWHDNQIFRGKIPG